MFKVKVKLTEKDIHTYEGEKVYIHFYKGSSIKKYEGNLLELYNAGNPYPIKITNNYVLDCNNDISPNDCFVFGFDSEEDAFYFALKFS